MMMAAFRIAVYPGPIEYQALNPIPVASPSSTALTDQFRQPPSIILTQYPNLNMTGISGFGTLIVAIKTDLFAA